MVRIGKFEVNILTCIESQARHKDWATTKEYDPPNRSTQKSGQCTTKYVVAPQSTDSEGVVVPIAFAVQFRLHGPLSEQFMNGAELIVFRVFHDDKRIGSGHVKRRDWERGLTYTVRKSSRRFHLADQGGWIKINWHLDEGRHGQIRIEVWRQVESYSYSGSWDAGLDVPFTSHEGVDFVDYFDPTIGDAPTNTRIRFTKRVDSGLDAEPDAKFIFEYRSEDTMRTIGVMKTHVLPRTIAPTDPIYDLTQEDDAWTERVNSQPVYDISDCSVTSPSKTTSSYYTSDDVLNNPSLSNSDNYSNSGLMQYMSTSGFPVSTTEQDDVYIQGQTDSGYSTTYIQQEPSVAPYKLQKAFQTQTEIIDLTMDD